MNTEELARRLCLVHLSPDSTRRDARRVCEEATAANLSSVFVLPTWTADGVDILEGSTTNLGSVVGFPHGNSSPATKAAEAATIVADGATEVWMVMNISALKSGADLIVIDELQSVADACAPGGANFGVILECPLLTADEKRRGAKIAEEMDAQFVVTETGFAPGTPERPFMEILDDVTLLVASLAEVDVLVYRHSPTLDEVQTLFDAGAGGIVTPNAIAFLQAGV